MPILPQPVHADVVRAAGNAYLLAGYEGVHTAVLSQDHELWIRTEAEPGWLAGPGRSVLLDNHQAIYDAVAAGDARAAQAAVRRHHEVMLEHLGRRPVRAGEERVHPRAPG
ncbi:MAG TPA: FCD domain-containing protein [Streptosporangiaceae bacterium]|jgi:GntR family transcriptional repressor for pyruvate dehydrogenase complex